MVAKTAGRSTRNFKKLRAQFRAQCESRKEPCFLCGQEIDYTIQFPAHDAWTLEHFYPVSTHPELAEDPAGFRAAHFKCNLQRSNKKIDGGGVGNKSRDW